MGRYRAAIFFDVDHTLWDFSAVLQSAFEALHAELNRHYPDLSIPKEEWDADRKAAREAYGWEAGLRQLRVISTTETLRRHGIYTPELSEALVEAFWYTRDHYPHVFDDVQSAFAALAPHFFLSTITNGGSDMRATPIAGLLQARINAPDVGAQKPDPAMFAAADAAAPAGIPRVIVGDSPVNDIQGGLDAGWLTVWVNRRTAEESELAHATVHTLTDLPACLDRLLQPGD